MLYQISEMCIFVLGKNEKINPNFMHQTIILLYGYGQSLIDSLYLNIKQAHITVMLTVVTDCSSVSSNSVETNRKMRPVIALVRIWIFEHFHILNRTKSYGNLKFCCLKSFHFNCFQPCLVYLDHIL